MLRGRLNSSFHTSWHRKHGLTIEFRIYFDGRALPNLAGLEGFGDSLGCLGFFFSFRLSLFPMAICNSVFEVAWGFQW